MMKMINVLKSILVVEFNQQLIPREQRPIILNEIYQYVCREIGIYDNPEDNSLKVLVLPSEKTNVQLLNTPEDVWKRFNDTLSERFSNIEEFINELYENSGNNN